MCLISLLLVFYFIQLVYVFANLILWFDPDSYETRKEVLLDLVPSYPLIKAIAKYYGRLK